ncbi:MAG: hypothetical protein EBW11_02120 [Betaproteobacteria bacterium]|nr:hypothetical protein [Betaproteobacteria bacterium]NCY20018.1 hypothetical protein [Betaproteobacteria bacterium]
MTQLRLREIALASACVCAAASIALPPFATAANKAKDKAAGAYVTGDFHNHSTCSDGTLSMKKLIDKSVNFWGLDWFVQADHGGASARNCTLAEDPFTPVTPALKLTNNTDGPFPPNTFPPGGQPAATGKGPNLSWQSTLANGVSGIKGDGTANPKAMWRWQEIKEYQYAVTESESRRLSKPIWMGIETNAPGHEHVSMTILDGQLPWPSTGSGNANLLAQFEYCFDRSDTDTSRGAENNWDCSFTGSPTKNTLVDATSKKIGKAGNLSGTNTTTDPDLGHTKSIEAIKWMNQVAPNGSYYVPAHLERAGVYDPTNSRGFNIEHLRNFHNAAPQIAFGFESMPGHQASQNRGEYGGTGFTRTIAGGTFGGTGYYAAKVGGVWDALLGEGRNWWFFASSDYHNRGIFGNDQLESTQDFHPGEYQRTHVMVRKGSGNLSAQGIIDGLRSGNSFATSGQIIDRLAFVVCAVNPALPLKANRTLLETAVTNAVKANTDVRIDGCATMGEKLVARPGSSLIVAIALRDPEGQNYSPYSFANPSLKQINITQPLNQPVLDHVDLISGNVSGFVSPTNLAAYAGEAGKVLTGTAGDPAATYKPDDPATLNNSARKIKTFNASSWTASAGGIRTMSFVIKNVQQSQYFRLRGTNLPPSTPNETDADGNPLLDWAVTPVDSTKPGTIPCTDAACPAHLRTLNGVKYSSFDVAAWSDLWFYANPVFVQVNGSVTVAGLIK